MPWVAATADAHLPDTGMRWVSAELCLTSPQPPTGASTILRILLGEGREVKFKGIRGSVTSAWFQNSRAFLYFMIPSCPTRVLLWSPFEKAPSLNGLRAWGPQGLSLSCEHGSCTSSQWKWGSHGIRLPCSL